MSRFFGRGRLRRGLVLSSAFALTTALSLLPSGVADAQHEGTLAPAARLASDSPGVMANLFEWNWPSVGKECKNVLGPAGYGGVQVAPPQDSVKRQKLGDGSNTILHPWWEVYQPVDYKLTSRMGSEAQFKAMVKTCRRAGVKVYVDAVINHMTGQGDTSYGGVTFGKYEYSGIYTQDNFHKYSGDCPSASGGIEDFNNKQQVFKCELVGLSDLRTDTPYVQNKLAGYLNKLLGYGVSGFRVDAAKHIGQDDLDAIYAKLNNTRDGKRPYWALEVFGGAPGILSPQAFTKSGNVLGLDGVKQIRDAFKSYPADHVGSIATLEAFGADSGLTASNKTLSFVQNHDTERNGDALNYKDGATNILATEWLLASGYGTPQVYSGFRFDTNDDSPPADADGLITNTDCSGTDPTWRCTDRDPGVLSMVGWHNYAGKAKQANWYDDGANVISFSRGNRAWIALNNGTSAKTIRVQTGLPKGTYCDVISGVKTHNYCTGTTHRVNVYGEVTVNVPAKTAVAFDRTDRIS